jgi:hypothetical protein
VLAFDDGSALPLDVGGARRGEAPPLVALGVDGADAAARHPSRTLLLVAPPPGAQAARWLQAYRGARLVFVGEGRGGAHGDDAFFDALEREWRLVDSAALQPFPGGAERMWVLERRGFSADKQQPRRPGF